MHSNAVMGTLAVDGKAAVTFGTARRWASAPTSPVLTVPIV